MASSENWQDVCSSHSNEEKAGACVWPPAGCSAVQACIMSCASVTCERRLSFAGVSCRYQLLELDRPHKVVFFGVSRFHENTDTVTFSRKPGTEDIVVVHYTTQIELIRWFR